MSRQPRRTTARQDAASEETSELLEQLLEQPVPERHALFRPVVLRSIHAQRRQALSAFLLRSWVDHLLGYTERVLVLALVGALIFWFFDGYGRDWLHARQQAEEPSTSTGPTTAWGAAAPLTMTTTLSPTAVLRSTPASGPASEHGLALPFIPAGYADEPAPAPDYLAPRHLPRPAARVDQRPDRLLIPSIGVDTPVHEVFLHNNVWQVADYAAGYHHGSALPGEPGNVVMAGHAGLRGAVFRDLGRLEPGARIAVDAGGWRHHYEVRQRFSVWPTQVEVMAPTPTPVLTLITCTDWDTRRLVVVADLQDTHPLNGDL